MALQEQYDALTVDEVAQLIAQGQEEHLQLEFKTTKADMNRGDRRELAKCISGFANSSGGIIVWGVVARQNGQGIDCATAPEEIEPVRLLLARLNEHTGRAASPIVDGIRHKILETSPNRGYAVTLVPESLSGPHMAKLGEDRYYKRSGASFYKMEHFDLEDMFGRRPKPDLHLTAIPMDGLGDERERVAFGLQNRGRALAKHVGFVAAFNNANIKNVSGPPMANVTSLNNDKATVSFEDNAGVVHPLETAMTNVGWAAFTRLDRTRAVRVEVTWYCEHMPARQEVFELPPPPLVNLGQNQGSGP
jgi:hypothetical protein